MSFQTLLKDLNPANFAFVMSSGAISMIFQRTGWIDLSWIILIAGSVGYAVLIALFILRFATFKTEVFQDFKDIEKMFKYLTFSAGSSALAVDYCLLGYHQVGLVLGLVGVFSAVISIYSLFGIFFLHSQIFIQAVSPFWLLLAIVCNSSGIVITTFWKHGLITNDIFLLLAFCFWTFGVSIYLVFMVLNIFRMLFFPFNGKDMNSCYWTCMGAAAIAVVDGSLLVLVHTPPLFLHAITPFIKGVLVFLWGWGTAWIPILCLMELLKAFYFKIPFHYQASLWAMVFPLGMFTAATDLLSHSVHLTILQGMVPVCLWIAFFFWCFVAYLKVSSAVPGFKKK